MIDFSFYDPPVEVAASSPRLEMIMSRLRASGLRPYPASKLPEPDAPDPLLIDLASADDAYAALNMNAAGHGAGRQLVFLCEPGRLAPCPARAICLLRDLGIPSLRSRLMAEARRLSRQRETRIRLETAIDLGAELPGPEAATAPSILYLGDYCARFLSLQKTLRERGISLTAALSHQTARQHMAGHRFTAALADITLSGCDAGGMARWITGAEGLRGLPMIALASARDELTEGHLELLGHASVILDLANGTDRMADRIETECRRLHDGAPMMPLPGLALAVTDIVSGLFNRCFFETHLPRQMAIAAQQAEPLSVLVLRLDVSEARSRPAQKTTGDIILRHIRETDCAALIQPGAFAISLPATPYRGGVRLAERIGEAMERAGAADHPGHSWRVTERRSYHTGHTLLSASLIGPFVRTKIAA